MSREKNGGKTKKGDRWGSNPQPLEPQSRAPPIELRSPYEKASEADSPWLVKRLFLPSSVSWGRSFRMSLTCHSIRHNPRAVKGLFEHSSRKNRFRSQTNPAR